MVARVGGGGDRVPSYCAGCWWWTVRFSVATVASAAGHPTRYPIAIKEREEARGGWRTVLSSVK